MSEWAETCSLAAINKPQKENTMALHPGEAGYQKQLECNETREFAKDQAEERRKGCLGDSTPRNRRAGLRMSDIDRSVDKALPSPTNDWAKEDHPKGFTTIAQTSKETMASGMFGNIPPVVTELRSLANVTQPVGFDKNTPESLKTLRWSIYELIDRTILTNGKVVAGCLKQGVEDLFKQFTNS